MYLIWSVEEADAVTDAKGVDVIRQAALGKLVRLNGIQPDYGLGHDAAVPIPTMALFTCQCQTHREKL